ncbi:MULTISPECIES: hypothetical protein [unclassified Lebetimonas]|uniref:hypothetical protein n=1 Tax=unclassified Lebetimonas TaxID=2648158 RepID=UPI000467E639|nr:MULTISPECIES: hypothetical protein [unclassified Lebetimonas]
MNLSKLSLDELKELLEDVKAEIKKRKTNWFSFKTPKCFNPLKHGPAYIAKLYMADERVEREFFNDNGKEWCKKKKYYKTSWDVELNEGDVIECRLEEGGKFDKREWYIVENGELQPLSDLSEAIEKLKN